ncbi:MAG: hypothetical protein WBZ29_13865 [Methanocella sp.]
MSTRTCLLMRATIFLTVFFVAVQVMDVSAATAETPRATFSGTVYYKNDPAAGATVSVNYAMQTFIINADKDGNYSLTVDYVGNGRAVLTASYNGDTDVFTWYLDAGAKITHDFWIIPRPAPTASEEMAATFEGHVYYGNTTVKGAHVILVYGKYILDQYTNDNGHYGLTIYYQGMPGRIWATYADGRSEDYWPNPGMGGFVVTDINITPMTGIPTATPAPTPVTSVTPTPGPEANTTASPTAIPAGTGTFQAMLISMAAITTAYALYRRK